MHSATDSGLPFFDFQAGHLTWRGLSSLFDLFTILAAFFIGKRLRGNAVGLLAAVFFAASPLAIQKAHFATVNSITAFLVTAALYFALLVQKRGNLQSYIFFWRSYRRGGRQQNQRGATGWHHRCCRQHTGGANL